MDMRAYEFSAREQAEVKNAFGEEFFTQMVETLNLCAKKWRLYIESLVPYFSVNCVFFCRSDKYGKSVLKIGKRLGDTLSEAALLARYDGRRYCRLHEADTENGALLIERLSPGKNLFYNTGREQRISIFAGLYENLHIEPHGDTVFPTYRGWIERFCKLAGNRDDIRGHGEKAMRLYDEIAGTYNKSMLLHGDLHHENIISNGAGYLIIDPKGVIGDPVFDCSRFIMDEFDDNLAPSKHDEIISFTKKLGEVIGIPAEVLLKCLYIETVIWMGEDLFFSNWLDGDMIDNALQAEKLMKLI